MTRNREITANEREYGLIVSGLRLLERKLFKDRRQSEARGFVPKPGAIDVNVVLGRELGVLMDRLGIKRKEG